MQHTDRVRALGPLHARLLAHVEEHAGDVVDWPWSMQQLATQHETLKFAARFQLTIFLLGNGVPPLVVATFMKGRVRDFSARRHVASIIEGHRTGAGSQWHFFDMHLRERVPLHAPSFARRMPCYWNDAVKVLSS